jgi:CubicO group peptidase (beta-lactamase class C family)
VAAYLRAHIDLPDTGLGKAIETATTIHAGPPDPVGYGWHHLGGGWWHNGGTGGFHSFAAFVRETRTGVALLANGGALRVLDDIGFRTLTEMTRAAGA